MTNESVISLSTMRLNAMYIYFTKSKSTIKILVRPKQTSSYV